jgi:hypothetical protein
VPGLSKKIRRLLSIFGSAAVAGVLAATMTSASATTSQTAATTTFALRGATAGHIKTSQATQTLTFVFTEINQGTASAPEDLVTTKVTNTTVVGNSPCVLPGGTAISSDGNFCEPGFVQPGQSASVVITTNVTGASGTLASVKVCLMNESTGVVGPCRTVSAKIA